MEAAVMILFVTVIGLGVIVFWQAGHIRTIAKATSDTEIMAANAVAGVAKLATLRNFDLASRMSTWKRAVSVDENCAAILGLFGERLNDCDKAVAKLAASTPALTEVDRVNARIDEAEAKQADHEARLETHLGRLNELEESATRLTNRSDTTRQITDELWKGRDQVKALDMAVNGTGEADGLLADVKALQKRVSLPLPAWVAPHQLEEVQSKIRSVSNRLDNFWSDSLKRLEKVESWHANVEVENLRARCTASEADIAELKRKQIANTTISRLKKFSAKLEATKKAPAKKKPTKGAKAK